MAFKSGYIAILGIPNVGKSTFLNAVLGEKLAIVSSKPQTTRQNLLGILNLKDAQLLFLDTPGIHQSTKRLNQFLIREAKRSIEDANLVIYLVEPKANLHSVDVEMIELIESKKIPYFLVVNKVDSVPKLELLNVVQRWHERFSPQECFLISSTEKDGVADLMKKIPEYLPEGPVYYPEDQMTNRDLRHLSAEIIRERVFEQTYSEVPYSVAVVIDVYEEVAGKSLDRISATIYVEKDSQKPIVIGHKGAMLKKIGEEARLQIEALSGRKVFLTLFVKVVKDWTKNERVLEDLGYGR